MTLLPRYGMMCKCWALDPCDRPSFSKLVSFIGEQLTDREEKVGPLLYPIVHQIFKKHYIPNRDLFPDRLLSALSSTTTCSTKHLTLTRTQRPFWAFLPWRNRARARRRRPMTTVKPTRLKKAKWKCVIQTLRQLRRSF